MSRRLIIANALLTIVAVVAVGYIYREIRRVPPPAPPPRRAAAPAPPPAAAPAPAEQLGNYAVVASRNLFSPTRSEAPAAAVSTAPPAAKPNLFGIVLRDGAPVAYLEDPTTKRVAGYRLGDSVAGGTVARIGNDHVVLNRPDGDVSVRLRDPSKPRPAAPAPVAGQAGPAIGSVPVGGSAPGAPTAPGVASMPPAAGQQPGTAPSPLPAPGTPGVQSPGGSVLPRRPLPPNLLRRLPPPATPQATPQSQTPAQN